MNDEAHVEMGNRQISESQFIEERLAQTQHMYTETKNPVWLWYAIDICSGRAYGSEPCAFPYWVTDYLYTVAKGFIDIAERKNPFDGKSIEVGKSRSLVPKLLGLQNGGGRTNQFSQFASNIASIALAFSDQISGRKQAIATGRKLYYVGGDVEARAIEDRIREGQKFEPLTKNSAKGRLK